MSDNVVRFKGKARFKPRSDYAENWQTINPILLSGEPGVVIDGTETEKIKFGDGVTPWNDLGWWKGPKGDKGDRGERGEKGENYILTNEDKNEIAEMAVSFFVDVSEVGQ